MNVKIDDEVIELDEVKRFVLGPDDVLYIHVAPEVSLEQFMRFRDEIKKQYGDRVFLLGGGATVQGVIEGGRPWLYPEAS